VLPHWEVHGDISGHRMCSRCVKQWGKNECPFCKEVLHKEAFLSFISPFANSVGSAARAADPNVSAALLEQVQFFEMENESNPRTVQRVFKLLAEDAAFCKTLDGAIKIKAVWLKDMAGIILRLHAMSADGEIQLGDSYKKRLGYATEIVFTPFERPRSVGRGTSLDHGSGNGHYYGALYMQCVVPFLCAWRAGSATTTLGELTQRAGRAIMHCYKQEADGGMAVRTSFSERAHVEYVALVSAPVWGSGKADPIMKTFFS